GLGERGARHGRARRRSDDSATGCARDRQGREDHADREAATTHRGPFSTSPCQTPAVPLSLIRILDARGASRLALSPDGGTLYYVSDLTGTVQLWSVPVGGGVPRRLSYEADRVGAYRLSPDGTRIAYGADEGGDERWALWVMNADGGEARRVSTQADRIHHVIDWTADGRGVLVFANLRDERFFDLHEFPSAGGTPKLRFRHDGTGFGATALHDGRVVVTTNRARGDQNHLSLVERDGSTKRLTPET